ncbi:uncharacterized protein LOC121740463 [Aricia agestis]|uniref:uncharacterized protein LOC121740463 n=1 Tax=Aricia agestis TaxID=91739 RepID=UPI001C209D39|nr:uncharacterized protein LOC121740463 [Aricia agestis]
MDFNNIERTTTTFHQKKCFFCGGHVHQRIKCPALNVTCTNCNKKGHYAKVCKGERVGTSSNAVSENELLGAISAASPMSLKKTTIVVSINNHRADALIDSGSSTSFIDENLVQELKLKRIPWNENVTLASKNNTSCVKGMCFVDLKMNEHFYRRKPLYILNSLCSDIIIGHDILSDHSSVELTFGGTKKPLKICNVIAASVPEVSLFANLSENVKPIAIKSRKHSEADTIFIENEIEKLLKDGVIEPTNSPWRAQVLVTTSTTHRKRLVIDYSLTINRFTELDAYPLPNIELIVSKVAQHKVFSQIDLKSAYHQVPILKTERLYTAFEACGNLYQFTRIPFGVTNGVAAFQRTLNFIITEEKLMGTYAYLDDVTICGKTIEEHDTNLKRFRDAVHKYNLTLNEEKCVYRQSSIKLLGYKIKNNSIQPDEDRVGPLMNLPVPNDSPSLKRALGMFAHYAKWIRNFSEKIHSLARTKQFPLSKEQIESFQRIKADIRKSILNAVDPNAKFTVETDASEHSLAASLSQDGRPVAFFSRSLNDSERRHSSVEKEACAIVESLRKWRHYLTGRHFRLITDQRSVSFMFNQSHKSKIKNEKIERWRLELSNYKYDIVYRPGRENVIADTLSRVCSSVTTNKLYELHNTMGHPGIVRMTHWIRSKNLPYTSEDVKNMTAGCRICAEIKPRFARINGNLIKATAPFERLNVDFKGPLPTHSKNRFILTIIDEYSRFPFAYITKDVSATTVIGCFKDLFQMYGTPHYIHSDRGAAFMSKELRDFLVMNGVACSRSTPYNPQGNGQVERLNGTLWKTIRLILKSKQMDIGHWEHVLPNALHSIRSLLCTSTNMTPHERFFKHPRRSANGESLPTWLLNPGPVLKKNYTKHSKYDPDVEEVELIEANPQYSYVRLADGREATISNKHLAPLPQTPITVLEPQLETETRPLSSNGNAEVDEVRMEADSSHQNTEDFDSDSPRQDEEVLQEAPSSHPGISSEETITGNEERDRTRRSGRQRKTPDYLKHYVPR